MTDKEPLQKTQDLSDKPLKKDKGCAFCEHIFDCPGKPPTVKLCVNFKERKRMRNDR